MNAAASKEGGSQSPHTHRYECDHQFSEELVSQLPFLHSLARTLCRDREIAADLAQQTALRAWQARQRYEIGSNMKAWLRVILRNEYSSVRRRAWRNVRLEPELEASLETCHQQELTAELADAVRAIHSLPPIQRRDFISVAIGGTTYREAAIAAHCSIGTTKSRVARARFSVRKMCEGSLPSSRHLRPPVGQATETLLSDLIDLPNSGFSSSVTSKHEVSTLNTSAISVEHTSRH